MVFSGELVLGLLVEMKRKSEKRREERGKERRKKKKHRISGGAWGTTAGMGGQVPRCDG